MAKLSRRKLIAGAVAAPLVLDGAASTSDPIVAAVAAWLIERAAHDAMAEEWGDFESKLIAKTRDKVGPAQARRSRLPEARAMRALDKRIAACWKRLERDARKVVLMRPTSAQGALAKIRLAVRIQGPYDWHEDYVYALVQDGCEQLALMLARAG
jgi:hypothetical protein